MSAFDPDVPLMTGDVPALVLDEATGKYSLNQDKLSVKWSWQPGRFNNQFPFQLAPNQTADFNIRVTAEAGGEGDVEVAAFMITTTGRVSCQPYIPQWDKHLSNVPLSTSLMFGSAQLQAMIAETIYSFPSIDWTLTMTELTGAPNLVSPVVSGRRFTQKGVGQYDTDKAKALSRLITPYWLGPSTATLVTAPGAAPITVPGGPEIALPPGATITLEFPCPGDAAFDCKWALDDSTSTTGLEPVMVAQIQEGQTGYPLNDVPMSMRDFLFAPTVAVAGFPSGGIIRAASLPSPQGNWTHLYPKETKIKVVVTSNDAGTITLRPCFAGVLIYAD